MYRHNGTRAGEGGQGGAGAGGGVLFDVARRRRLGPILAAGNIYVVLAGLLEHAMLPAEISSSGLKTLLLHGVRLIPGHLYTDGI